MTGALDLWDLSSGNRIIESNDELLVRSILRDLLAAGESLDNLSLDGPDFETAIDGPELAAWLEAQ
jgi:hypothetical protein